MTQPWLAICAAVALAGCAAIEPDVGPLLAGSCKDADTNPKVSVSFASTIRPLLDRPFGMGGCGCHVPGDDGAGIGTAISGLNLSSLALLRQGGAHSGQNIVIAGQPCESILYQKVSDAPPFGSRMPLGGPYFSEEELAQLHDWIAEGALDN